MLHTSPCRHPARRLRRRAGVTLIEMMVAIILIAMVATGITYGLNAVTRANLRSGAMKLSSAMRYAYNRAIAENSTVRLQLNLERNTMAFQEAHGRVTLTRANDRTRLDLERDGEQDLSTNDPWATAQARLDSTFNPSFGASPFSTISGRRFAERPLASGVEIIQLRVPHEPEPREDGVGGIYFFPGGQTEHAIIWLGDSSESVYSVEVHPLTGRTRVYPYAFEPEDLLSDGEGRSRSEVDDR